MLCYGALSQTSLEGRFRSLLTLSPRFSPVFATALEPSQEFVISSVTYLHDLTVSK